MLGETKGLAVGSLLCYSAGKRPESEIIYSYSKQLCCLIVSEIRKGHPAGTFKSSSSFF